ncbi:MAG: amidoligase family protein [Hyphomonadaceae bacterium]
MPWKMGFEIELLAPPGLSRRDLAQASAHRCGGSVERIFHQQAEVSATPGRHVFENLTLGFKVVNAAGAPVATFVDDLTLQADLAKDAAPREGWYRIVADDARLLRLTARHCDAAAPLHTVLAPLAALFGTSPQPHATGMVRVVDDRGASVAIGAPLPGERERPCEIVTAPIEASHESRLQALLDDAAALGFTAPKEGATHIHFDGAPLQSAPVFARLVNMFDSHGGALKQLLGCNPNCVRLGAWPAALREAVNSEAFQSMDWADAAAALNKIGLSKYCDYNVLNLVIDDPDKRTFEVRVLPTHLTAAPIMEAAQLIAAMLRWCCDTGAETPAALGELIARLALPEASRQRWRAGLAPAA